MPMKIVDCRSHRAQEEVEAQRRAGYPCVLTGFSGMTCFASNWVGAGGKTNFKRLCKDLGNEIVTCIKNQDMSCVGKEGGLRQQGEKNLVKMTLRKFISLAFKENNRRKSSKKSDSGGTLSSSSSTLASSSNSTDSSELYYLHQWQFGVSASARQTIDELSLQSQAREMKLPGCLGNDHLRGVFEEFDGRNPYQYLFCGPAGTWTPLHQDPGGLAILIAPITGEKELTLVHRDDAHMVGDSWKTAESLGKAPDLHRQPMASFARVWCHTVVLHRFHLVSSRLNL